MDVMGTALCESQTFDVGVTSEDDDVTFRTSNSEDLRYR
jgi:hypothetical protein